MHLIQLCPLHSALDEDEQCIIRQHFSNNK